MMLLKKSNTLIQRVIFTLFFHAILWIISIYNIKLSAEQSVIIPGINIILYDDLGRMYIDDTSLHLGITEELFSYKMFATEGTQSAVVELATTKNAIMDSIFIEADINAQQLRSTSLTQKSAVSFKNNFPLSITQGLIITKNVSLSACNTINSNCAAISIELPLSSDIINYGKITGDFAILGKNGGYLSGKLINHGIIDAKTVYKCEANIANDTEFTLLNKNSGSIIGDIFLSSLTATLINDGNIGSIDNKSNLNILTDACLIENSGYFYVDNVITDKQILSIKNHGYVYVENDIAVYNFHNYKEFNAKSLLIADNSANFSILNVDSLSVIAAIEQQNKKLINFQLATINIKDKDLIIDDAKFENHGTLNIANRLSLSGTFTNKGFVAASNLVANNNKFIVENNQTAEFKHLGETNDKLFIINYGEINIKNQDGISDFSGNIDIHKNNNEQNDGTIKLHNSMTYKSGCLNLGNIITPLNTDIDFTLESMSKIIIKDKLYQQYVNVSNKGYLQLKSGSRLKSYKSTNGYLGVMLTDNLADVDSESPLLKIDEFAEFIFPAKIVIIPPKKTPKNISKLVSIIDSELKFLALDIYNLEKYFITDIYNGATHLTLEQIEINNNILQAKINIRSLIGFLPDTEYAKQKLSDDNQTIYGVAWNYNKFNNKYSSNNLIVTPSILACKKDLLSFNSNKKFLEIGSKTSAYKVNINAEKSLPAIAVGTTVIADDNFINSATNENLTIAGISLYNIIANARDNSNNLYDKQNDNGLVINGVHPLCLTDISGLMLDKSVALFSGNKSCALSIVASTTANINNFGTIGDQHTGTAIAINNYFKGSIINSGTLQANNHAIYINPNKYGITNSLDINIENQGLILGNIYINATKKNSNSAIVLANYNKIYASSIFSKNINNLSIVNKTGALLKVTDLAVTNINNQGNLIINNKLISNKTINLKNTGCSTITNTFLLEKDFVNNGYFYSQELQGNNYNFFNNKNVFVARLKDITVINKNVFQVSNLITGLVNIDSELQIKNIVQLTEKSKLIAKNIVLQKNSKLINNKDAKIKITGKDNLVITKNNLINYGDLEIKKSIEIDKYFINNGNIKTENIIATDGCIENKLPAKLICKNLGTKNNKLEIIGNIYLQPNYETNGIISGDVILHASSTRQADGRLTTSENIHLIDGNFYLGSIENQKSDFTLDIENNSFCKIKHVITDDEISIINKGKLSLSQGSKIKNYNSTGGKLLLNILDIESITAKDTLLVITNEASLDANSTIIIRPCGVVPEKINKRINIITTFTQDSNQQGDINIDHTKTGLSFKLLDTIKVGSVLLKISDVSISSNAITAKLTRADLFETNPNILLANQTLYNNIYLTDYKSTRRSEAIALVNNEQLVRKKADTINLIISPIEAVVTENVVDYSLSDKNLHIASNIINLQSIYANYIGYPALTLGISIDEDNNFTKNIIKQDFDINTISIDSINIDGSCDEDGINADEDGLLINADNTSRIIVKDKLVIHAGAKIIAGNNSSALNIIPYFIGNIVNYGEIGDENSAYGVRINNSMSGKLINKNFIQGSKAAFVLNMNDEVDDRNFVLINKANIYGNILIKETQKNKYNIVIDNYGFMQTNSIHKQGVATVKLTNKVDADLEINSWNIDHIYNKGNLYLLDKNYYLNDELISNYGKIQLSGRLIIDNNFTNNGTLSSISLESQNTKHYLDNYGTIIVDNIAKITIKKTGDVCIKKNIDNLVLIESTVTMLGDIIANDKAKIILGGLSGKNFTLTNKANITCNDLIVKGLVNKKGADLTVKNNLLLSDDSVNYGSIVANDIFFLGGKLINKINSVIYLNNFKLDTNHFENQGELQVDKILYLNNDYINNGKITTETLFSNASCLTIDSKASLECCDIRTKYDFSIINEGVLSVANALNPGIIAGSVTIHKDRNKNQDGSMIIYGDMQINGNLTTGKIKSAIIENEININKGATLKITLSEKEERLNLNNDGELILASASVVKKYCGDDNGVLIIEVDNYPQDGETWFSAANHLQLSDKTLIAIKPKQKFLSGVSHKINIIDTNSALIRKRKAGNLEAFQGHVDKSLIVPLAHKKCIFHLNNIHINDVSFGDTTLYSSITADVTVLDTTNLDNNMAYADQLLIPKFIGDAVSDEVQEFTGVAWKDNFFQDTMLASSNNLIVSPVELLTNIKQLYFEIDKKVLSIGTSTSKNNNFFATKKFPAVVIGTTILGDNKFIEDATDSLVLDSINIDNINIYSAKNTKTKKFNKKINFQDALLFIGENKLKLTGKTGLTLGKNAFLHADVNAALQLGLAFEGSIYNEGIIEAEADAAAIKINNFICGTITNKNTIKAILTAIDLNQQNAKKYNSKPYLHLVNEATFSGDISLTRYNKSPEYLDFSIINKGYFNAEILKSSGEINFSITNNCSATMKIHSLQTNINLLKNNGVIEINNKNQFYANDNNFINNYEAIFNNFYVDATLTNNAKLKVKNFYSKSDKSIIYNNNELHIDNIASDIKIKNSGVLSVNNSCLHNVFITGTLTVNNELKTINYGKLVVDNVCIKGKIINSENYQIKSNSSLTINNNFENYGQLNIDANLVLASDFINKGNVFANNLIGHSKKFYISPNKKAVFSNIGEASNSLTIINKGELIIKSNDLTSAKIDGDLQIVESTLTNKLARLTISGLVEYNSGILSAKSLIAHKNSVFTLHHQAHSIFTDNLQLDIAIINQGELDLVQDSKIKFYDGRDGILSLSINKTLEEKIKPLLEVKETAVFNNKSKIKIKLANNALFYRNMGSTVDLIFAHKGLKNIISDLEDINVIPVQLQSSILLSITDVNIIDNKIIRAHLFFTNTIDFLENMLPASQRILIEKLAEEVKNSGVAWHLNKHGDQTSTNNLIISPNELVIDKKLINFDCDTKNLYIGEPHAEDIGEIFLSRAEAAIVIGTEIAIDNHFTALNKDKLLLNKIIIDNITINSSRYEYDYSIADKDSLLINGDNDLVLAESPGLIIGDKVNISPGVTSTAINIFPRIIGDIINYGVLGSANNAVAIKLRHPLAGTLTNKNLIRATTAIDYLEHKLTTDKIDFNIINESSLKGDLLFDTQGHKSNNTIKLYNNNSIVAGKIISSANVNVNIYNSKQGELIADNLKISYLDNQGSIKILGKGNLEIADTNFNNQGNILVNNLLLKDDANNLGLLQINRLIGNNNTLYNKGDIFVKNIADTRVDNTGLINITNEISGKVSIIGKLNILDIITVNSGADLTANQILANNSKIDNYGNIFAQSVEVDVIDNKANSILQVDGVLSINNYSYNSGNIAVNQLQINNTRLSNLIGANLHVAGKSGFKIDQHSFANWGDLVVDHSLIIESDFITNGNISSSNINTNSIKLTIAENKTACFHNMFHNGSELNIVNKGKLIIGNNNDHSFNLIDSNITVSNDNNQQKDGIVTLVNDINQMNGILHAGKLISEDAITYKIEQPATSIFEQAIDLTNVNVINKGVLKITSGSKFKSYDGDLGTLVISIDEAESYSRYNIPLLLITQGAYLSDKSKIIISAHKQASKNINPVTVNVLQANEGVIYTNLDTNTDDLTKILFGISTNSIFWQVKQIEAKYNNIQALLVPYDVTDIEDDMNYADITLSKELFSKLAAEDRAVGSINWQGIVSSEKKSVKKTVSVAPHTVYSKKKALTVNDDSIEIVAKTEQGELEDDSFPGIIIQLGEEELLNETVATPATPTKMQHASEPLIAEEESQAVAELKTVPEQAEFVSEPLIVEDVEDDATEAVESATFTLKSKKSIVTKNQAVKPPGKKIKDPHKNITIGKKINVRKYFKQITSATTTAALMAEEENRDAVILYGEPKKILTDFKKLTLTANAQLTPLENADALHINIPASITIINKGIIGDSTTGVGLKITQPILAVLNNSGIIAGKAALDIDIAKPKLDFNQQPYIIINNQQNGNILGSLFFNSDSLNYKSTIVNFAQIKSATIEVANNMELTIENKPTGIITADYIKANTLHNAGTLTVNKNLKVEQFTNYGTAKIKFDWALDTNIVNSGILEINKFHANGYHITNTKNAELYVNELDNIKIINQQNAKLEVKKNITNNVEVIGDVYITNANDIQQTGNFSANKLLCSNSGDTKFIINDNSTASFQQDFILKNLTINNYGELNIQAHTCLKAYKAFSGTLNIKLPYNFSSINRPLLFSQQEVVFNNVKGKIPFIKLCSNISSDKKLVETLIKQDKILLELITAPKLSFSAGIEGVESILAMHALKSDSLFINIENPYISEGDEYTSIYATVGWKNINDQIDMTKYPVSIAKMALVMQASLLSEKQRNDIKESIFQGIENKYLPEEARNIISYLLNNREQINLYKPIIQDIQIELEKIFTNSNNEFIDAVKAILPDSSIVDVRTDTSLAIQALDNLGIHFTNKHIKSIPANLLSGVNSGYVDDSQGAWYCLSFSMTKENIEPRYKSNRWNSSLASIGIDSDFVGNISLGLMGSYAKSTVSPWENDYAIISRGLTTVLASCYLGYASENLNSNLAFIWSKNNHQGDYGYNIISKNYSTKYTTNLLGAMFEISYPFEFSDFNFDISHSLKIVRDQVPDYDIGIYEKHNKQHFYSANCSMGVYTSSIFKVNNDMNVDCSVAIIYAYDFDINHQPLCTEMLGKKFFIKYKNQSSYEFNINLHAKMCYKDKLNLSCNAKYAKLSYRNTLGLTIAVKYLF